MRQSDKMHEENIYAAKQCGLFKRKVKEQLFCSSILMLTKYKKNVRIWQKDHTQPRKRHWQRGGGGVTLGRDPEWEANESKGPHSQNHQPRSCRRNCCK